MRFRRTKDSAEDKLLNRRVNPVGRHADSTILLDDFTVSLRHADFQCADEISHRRQPVALEQTVTYQLQTKSQFSSNALHMVVPSGTDSSPYPGGVKWSIRTMLHRMRRCVAVR
jgi:hypothetical protein